MERGRLFLQAFDDAEHRAAEVDADIGTDPPPDQIDDGDRMALVLRDISRHEHGAIGLARGLLAAAIAERDDARRAQQDAEHNHSVLLGELERQAAHHAEEAAALTDSLNELLDVAGKAVRRMRLAATYLPWWLGRRHRRRLHAVADLLEWSIGGRPDPTWAERVLDWIGGGERAS